MTSDFGLNMHSDKFFTRLDWSAFWTATLVTFAVYFYTLGPSVGLEDSGELATAAAHLGVPHPPGYPFWTLCSWLFCKLFSWVTYMGHPTPAWAVSCCSAVFGALAAGCTAMLICRSSRDFISGPVCDLQTDRQRMGAADLLSFAGGVAGALTFALSPVEWSQSTIVEIYSLNALFLMWVFLLSYRWMRKPSDKILWFTAFVFGLGLTNYQVLVFAIVPLAIIIAVRNIGMFRDVFTFLVPAALTYQVLQIGSLRQASSMMSSDVIAKHDAIASCASCPSSTMLVVGIVVLLASLVAALVMNDRGKKGKAFEVALWGGGAGAVLLLLAATLFTGPVAWDGVSRDIAPLIPPWRYAAIGSLVAGSVVAAILASFSIGSAQDETGPATVNFGEWISKRLDSLSRDWASFGENVRRLVLISAALAVCAILLAAFVPQADLKGYAGVAYPWAKSTFVFCALIAVFVALALCTRKGFLFAIPALGMQIAAFLLLRHGALNGLTHPASWYFAWPIVWNFVLLSLAWATLPHGRSVAGAAFFTQLGVSFYVYMPIVSDLRNPPMNWGFPRTWDGFKHALQRGQYEAIGIPEFKSMRHFFDFLFSQMWHYAKDVMLQFTDVMVLFVFVPFVAAKWIVHKTEKKTFWQWMAAAAACFLMMSLLLMLLAQVKGDVQDGFIQKVKFISSHAMIALWIGYGIVFAGAILVRFARIPDALKRRCALVFAAGAVLVALVAPIVQNWTDERMVFELGGCEQNDHTFGWQFGAYQLDGAKAIKEQLVADEEPLPDPDWPEPMEPFSIFFGGTDPGRFVPTYMIYSANFRPDVYLITQNALADDTYMAVERDLYGDEIWIPAKEDSSDAFSIYIDEVQRGVRPANGDLKIENGRVQVTGALGVMEINGILTEMMFKHDRTRHDFYIEESYVIPWMYPYLSPHGLIMKINRDRTPYDAKTAAKDRDFWDWYTRRLLKDPMYRRDFAAQKSFSKLRASIAGLYAKQGRRNEAANAFRESLLLYPASPEAVYRYAQESLLPALRFDQIMEMLDYQDFIDPNNTRSARMRAFTREVKSATDDIHRLEAKRRTSSLNLAETLELAQAYYSLNRAVEAAMLLRTSIEAVSDPTVLLFMSRVFMSVNHDADAERALQKFLKLVPDKSVEAWLSLAKIQHRTGRDSLARRSFMTALSIDRAKTAEYFSKDQEIYDIAFPLMKKK